VIETSTFWLRAAACLYALGLLHSLLAVGRKNQKLYPVALGSFRIGVVLHFVSLIEASMAYGRLPLDTVFEALNVCAFLIALVFLFFPDLKFTIGESRFDMHDLAFPGGLALLVLFALELADRVMMKRDLEIAREIQSWLMPAAPPDVRGVDIAFATRPANTVAGDYYDAFARPAAPGRSERLLLVVADVAGKSVPAALLMATLQASVHTLASLPASLLELVESLNQYVCAQNPGGHRFTTAFLAEFEPASGRLAYVNAGHNWPVLRRSTGEIERLRTGGVPLGIMPNSRYEHGSTTVAVGDLLLIFTDGLVEAQDEKEQEYGEIRMLAILEKISGGTAAEVMQQLMTSVDAFVGAARQFDDITCLVMRATSPA